MSIRKHWSSVPKCKHINKDRKVCGESMFYDTLSKAKWPWKCPIHGTYVVMFVCHICHNLFAVMNNDMVTSRTVCSKCKGDKKR